MNPSLLIRECAPAVSKIHAVRLCGIYSWAWLLKKRINADGGLKVDKRFLFKRISTV